PIAGPINGSLRVEVTRLAPLVGLSGDEGRDKYFTLTPDPDGSQGDRVWQPGEKEARDRVDLFPRASATFALGRFAAVAPYAAWREDLYFGEASGTAAERGYPVAGLHHGSRLVSGGERYRHVLEPSIELRSI